MARSTRRTYRFIAPLLLAAVLFGFAASAQVDKLVADLGGDNEPARSLARQLLPREGVAVVPRLLPYFREERDNIWRAARMTIADIANRLVTTGDTEGQQQLADIMLALLAPSEGETMKIRAMELLPMIVPEGHDVGPIAFLLKDATLQERAREVLYEIGTTEALAALRAALPAATPAMQSAILDGLTQTRDEATVPLAMKLSGSDAVEVRVSAARCLAATGSPRYAGIVRDVFDSATGAQQFEAGKAFVRLADEMVAHGGNFGAAMAIYRDLVNSDIDTQLRAAALVGLGRHGDAGAVPFILSVVQNPDNALIAGPGIAALGALRGKEARDALIAAFDGLPTEIQIPLVLAFGQKGDAVYMPLLQQATVSSDPDLRDSALTALLATRTPEAVAPLVAAAESAEGDDRAQRIQDLANLASALRQDGQAKGAGEAFLALYRLSEDEAQRAAALEGIRQFPVAEAYDVILGAFGEEELAKLSTETMAAIIRALHEAGRADEAKEAYEKLLNGPIDAQSASHVLSVGGMLGYGAELRSRLGFLTTWWMVGPFGWSPSEDFTQQYLDPAAIDLQAELKDGDEPRIWQVQSTEEYSGLLELTGRFGAINNACIFALVRIEVPEETDAQLRMGTDDGVKAWVNGEVVHENNPDRGLTIDSDVAPIHLKAGENEILLQVTQRGGGWAMVARLTDGEGKVLPFKMAD